MRASARVPGKPHHRPPELSRPRHDAPHHPSAPEPGAAGAAGGEATRRQRPSRETWAAGKEALPPPTPHGTSALPAANAPPGEEPSSQEAGTAVRFPSSRGGGRGSRKPRVSGAEHLSIVTRRRPALRRHRIPRLPRPGQRGIAAPGAGTMAVRAGRAQKAPAPRPSGWTRRGWRVCPRRPRRGDSDVHGSKLKLSPCTFETCCENLGAAARGKDQVYLDPWVQASETAEWASAGR